MHTYIICVHLHRKKYYLLLDIKYLYKYFSFMFIFTKNKSCLAIFKIIAKYFFIAIHFIVLHLF